MAKKKTTAYDIGDILGVNDPVEEKPKAKKPTPKKKQAKKPTQKPAGDISASRPADHKTTQYREKRDARLQAVIPKRLLDALKVEADNAGVSVNEVVNTLLDKGLKKRG